MNLHSDIDMSPEQQIAHLRLIRTPNIGPNTFTLLMRRYGTAIEALRAVPELAKRGGRHMPLVSRALAEAEIAAHEAAGAIMLFKGCAGYPTRLAQFEDAPALLSAKGNLDLLRRPSIAITGARHATDAGKLLAQSLATDIAREGYAVISGLERGIDTAAHDGALAGGTIAVMPGGIDVIHPPENAGLQGSIAETGLLLAEMPPGTTPTPRQFSIRNRIIAGLALGVVVIEASEASASLAVAREAAERDRKVMAVPGTPVDPLSRGGNQLIRDGATLIQNKDDIVESITPTG